MLCKESVANLSSVFFINVVTDFAHLMFLMCPY
jgi:hypothetical protein